MQVAPRFVFFLNSCDTSRRGFTHFNANTKSVLTTFFGISTKCIYGNHSRFHYWLENEVPDTNNLHMLQAYHRSNADSLSISEHFRIFTYIGCCNYVCTDFLTKRLVSCHNLYHKSNSQTCPRRWTCHIDYHPCKHFATQWLLCGKWNTKTASPRGS